MKMCTDAFVTKEELRDRYLTQATMDIIGAQRQQNNFKKDFNVNRIWGATEYYKDAIENWRKAMDVIYGDNEFDKEMKSKIRLYWKAAYDTPLPDYYK